MRNKLLLAVGDGLVYDLHVLGEESAGFPQVLTLVQEAVRERFTLSDGCDNS